MIWIQIHQKLVQWIWKSSPARSSWWKHIRKIYEYRPTDLWWNGLIHRRGISTKVIYCDHCHSTQKKTPQCFSLLGIIFQSGIKMVAIRWQSNRESIKHAQQRLFLPSLLARCCCLAPFKATGHNHIFRPENFLCCSVELGVLLWLIIIAIF